jgi:hypothetical protein
VAAPAPDGQIELHPDRRVQQAIRMVLDKNT